VLISFRNINNFGNNIYLDDIRVVKTVLPARDAALLAITDPLPVVCEPTITPMIRFVNLGTDTLRSLGITYTLDDGTTANTLWSGTLARLQGAEVRMPSTASGTGNRNLIVTLSNPNGFLDEVPLNDSGFLAYGVKTVTDLPLRETFEQSGFPPTGWNIVNPDRSITWERTTLAARNGSGSIRINHFDYTGSANRDEFISPIVRYANVDSIYLQFQLSASTRVFPGSTSTPLDTLEVLVSTDCGKTYSSVYRKWGAELLTTGQPNEPNPLSFIPNGPGQWRLEQVNLTSLLGTTNSFLVAMRSTGNGGNNMYVDDLEIFTRLLPERLKKEGFLISPNPFRSSFQVQFYPGSNKLRGIEVYNMQGQQVFTKSFPTGSAESILFIDLARQAAGVYSVRIRFEDRVEVRQVIKQ
jgi:hypothetical protein